MTWYSVTDGYSFERVSEDKSQHAPLKCLWPPSFDPEDQNPNFHCHGNFTPHMKF